MRADYHFHPNLQGKLRGPRLRAIWSAFAREELDAVICAEHAFKDPAQAYRSLQRSRPADARTQVFPGAELVTSEGLGVDIIAFAEDDWYDRYPELLEPFAMTSDEMLRALHQTDLSYFVPHPYIPHNPLLDLCPTDSEMCAFLERVGAYEAFNGCFLSSERTWKRIFPDTVRRFCDSAKPDASRLPAATRFAAVGSDAHHPGSIGLSVDIPASPRSRDGMFHALISNTDVSAIHLAPNADHPIQFVRTFLTCLLEASQRKLWKAYRRAEGLFRDEEPALFLEEMTPEVSVWNDTDRTGSEEPR